MPSGHGSRSAVRWGAKWGALSSQQERVLWPGDPALPGGSRWPGLASSGERLAGAAEVAATGRAAHGEIILRQAIPAPHARRRRAGLRHYCAGQR